MTVENLSTGRKREAQDVGSFTDSCAAFRWPGPMTHSAGDGAAGRAPKRAAMRPLPSDRCSSSVRFPGGCFGGWWAGTKSGAFPRRGILRGPHPVGGQEERRYCGDQREEGEQSVRSRRPNPSSGTPPLRSVKASTSRSIRQRRPLRPPRRKRIYKRFHRTAPGADAAFAGMGETRGFPDRPAYSPSRAAAERGRRGWIWTVQSARKAEG